MGPWRDEINATVYPNVNNGVYRCGLATTRKAYEEAFHALFESLDALDTRLGQQRHLVGDRVTEADWQAVPFRLDPRQLRRSETPPDPAPRPLWSLVIRGMTSCG